MAGVSKSRRTLSGARPNEADWTMSYRTVTSPSGVMCLTPVVLS